jgi:hypothetical protein
MDRIKASVMPNSIANNTNTYNESEFDYSNNDLSGLDSSRYTRMPYGQENYTRPYTNYGDYSSNPIQTNNLGDELAQMEYNMFGTEFSNEDIKTRLKRLNSVNRAKKAASKYDSQKFQQRMSTAMEIGAMILMILAMVL